MKTARLPLLMILATLLLPGTSRASQVASAPQQAPSQSSEKSANDQKNGAVRSEKDQAQSGESEVDKPLASVTRAKTKHAPTMSHSKPAQSHRPRPARTPTTNSPRTAAPGNIAALKQTGSRVVTPVPKRAVSQRGPSAPPSVVSVNGQQFKNSRDPGARLAISGGPLTAARGTAAISGTNMKHKP